MIRITLPDGKTLEKEKGVRAGDVVKDIGEGLYKSALAVKINGEIKGLNEEISSDCSFVVLTFKDQEGKEIYWHTASHILAHAIKSVYPTAKLAIGPSVKNGFYYDIEFKNPITLEDFSKIEAEMQKIIKADFPITRIEMEKAQAIAMMKKIKEVYKAEIIEEVTDEKVSFYVQGDFADLCRGPHLPSTGKVKAFRLTQLAGAYWRGNEKNKMLTRIYGTAFENKKDLDEYLEKVEEAKKRDHNKIGRELGFFMTEENIGQGLPLLMPKGAKVLQILQRFVEDEEQRRGYQLTKTPYMAKKELYQISGHWDLYRDGMFVIGDENNPDSEVLALRPMTCPFQYMIYKNGLKSYRDLPIRYNETSTLFRNENSGEMHGLIRIRQFTLSEGHIIVRPDQMESEFREVLNLIGYFMKTIGLHNDVTYRFSRRDKDSTKYVGTNEEWETAESWMGDILKNLNIEHSVGIGEAAFYGPKLDIQIVNVYGKEDTLITLQVDLALSKRFDMTYVDVDGSKKNPYILHRSSIGCYERTLALLIEKYNGALPMWLAPVQVKVLSLTDRTADKVYEINNKLNELGIRSEVDVRAEKIGYKIREAQLEKVPYMFVVGDKEAELGCVSVRHRKDGDIGQLKLEEIIKIMQEEIVLRSYEK